MFKYYYNGESISSKEYEERLIDDAFDCGHCKTSAMRIVRENRQEAREEGKNEWTVHCGSRLTITFKKGGKANDTRKTRTIK